MKIKSLLHRIGLGVALLSTLTGARAQTTLISTNTPWRYLDNGSDQGTAWRGAAFDDSGWASGVPLFGTESPGIYPWPIRTPMPVGSGRITYYFRTHFAAGSPTFTNLTASGYFDDGAVFYVNGVEAGRVRVAANPVAFDSLASSASTEGPLEVLNLAVSNLVAGDNLIAVELHQFSIGSSDAIFGITMEGRDGVVATPRLFLNEWLANNVNGLVDPADGQHDDWFEIYNPNTNAVDLAGLYLTDSPSNQFKFQIPPGYTVPPGGYRLVWADNQPQQNSTNLSDLHVNFVLSTNGYDGVFLSAADGTVIDAITIGPQTPDVSEGRWPDGGTNRHFLSRATPGAPNAPPCPVAWWPMEGSVTDTVGANQPSATASLSYVPGQISQGVSVGSGGYIEIPHSPALANQQFTIEAWVRPDGIGPTADEVGSVILVKNRDGGFYYGLSWRADGRFVYGTGPTGGGIIYSLNSFPAGCFYHVAGTYDGATFQLFVNGVLEGQRASSDPIDYSGGLPWTIGATALVFRNQGYPRTWNGVIDEVKICNRALSGAEIADAYVAGGRPRCLSAIKVFINEWLANNVNGLVDPADGQHDDWFEIYNPGTSAVSLDGYFLSDIMTNQFKFQIPPGYTVPPGGYRLVWADNQPQQNTTNSPDLHVNFTLTTNGYDGVFLSAADGTVIDAITIGAQTPDVSEGRFPDGGTNRSFMPPTPRAPNVPGLGSDCCEAPAQNLIRNGSFEDAPGLVTDPDGSQYFANPNVPDWTGTGLSGGAATIELWNQNAISMTAQNGSQHLELNAQSGDETVYQVVTGLVPGCRADFCFWYAGRPGMPDNRFTVTLSGAYTYSDTQDPASDGVWIQHSTVSFYPSSTTLIISFRGWPIGGAQGGAHIDNVKLCQCCPRLDCPEDIVVDCTNDFGAFVSYPIPTASSDCCPPPVTVTVTCDPPPGWFPIGVTPVCCTAVDSCFNTNKCCFCVTVRGHGYDEWKWAHQAGSPGVSSLNGSDSGNAIAVDKCGNVFVTGSCQGTMGFDNNNTVTLPPMVAGNNGNDIFLAKYDRLGNLLWAVRAGGAGQDAGYGVAVDDDGSAYITGEFTGNATFGSLPPLNASLPGDRDILVAKYDPFGTCVWAERFGDANPDSGYGIAIAPNGDVLVTGEWVLSGTQEAFVLRLNFVNGATLASAYSGGQPGHAATGRAITVDANNEVYVAGDYANNGIWFETSSTSLSPLAPWGGPGYARIFVVKIPPAIFFATKHYASWLQHSSHGSASCSHGATGIAVDPTSASVYLTGIFNGTADFGNGASLTSAKNGVCLNQLYDYLIVKLNTPNGSLGSPVWAIPGGGAPTSDDETRGIAVDFAGNPCVTGFLHPIAPSPFVNEGPTVLVAGYSPAGVLRWTRYANDGLAQNAMPEDVGRGIAVDSAGCVHVTGDFTEDLSFPPLTPPLVVPLTPIAPLRDVFVAKMCPNCGCEGPNLVCNGSFESPVVSPLNYYQQFQSVPWWTGTDSGGGAATVELWNGSYGNMFAQDGQQHLEINSAIGNETVFQVVTGLDPHCPTTFSFWYAGRPGFGNNTFQADLLGITGFPVIFNPAPYINASSWQLYTSLPFYPPPSLTIRFTGMSGPLIYGGAHIDHVSLVQDGHAPPPMHECCASLCGMKYNDLDADGVKDVNEPGVQGFVIEVRENVWPFNVIATAVTDANGNYCVTVPAGTYQVCEVPQTPQWIQTSLPLCYNPVVAASGAIITGLDFGNRCESPQGSFTFVAGIIDNYAGTFEPASPGPCLLSKYGPWKNFDDPTSNRSVGHTFLGLPPNIVAATLTIVLRPNGDIPGNDTIHVGLVEHLGSSCSAGATWLSSAPFPGAGTYTLPLFGPLLAKLASDRLLDVMVQDDHTLDYMQLTLRTCDLPVDTDGDGMPDYWELANGFDPNDPSNAALDPDGDGLTNLEEYLAGTDPQTPNVPPQIASQPQSVVVRPGTNVTFAVEVNSTVPVAYQWRFNGSNLAGATASSLTITNVQLSNDGGYSVVVSAANGTVTSDTATLTVLINPVITQQPLSQSVAPGGLVTLSVAITGHPAPFGYEWRRGTTPLASNTSPDRVNFFSFIAPNVVTSQQYRVVVRNPANPSAGAASAFATITVLADSDEDGIVDVWESQFGLNPFSAADRNLDADGDGMTNWEEYFAGTDPTDPLSRLWLEPVSLGAGTLRLRFEAAPNHSYTVEATPSLGGQWGSITNMAAQPVLHTNDVTVPFGTNAARFFRVKGN